jgi:hypothetical protein
MRFFAPQLAPKPAKKRRKPHRQKTQTPESKLFKPREPGKSRKRACETVKTGARVRQSPKRLSQLFRVSRSQTRGSGGGGFCAVAICRLVCFRLEDLQHSKPGEILDDVNAGFGLGSAKLSVDQALEQGALEMNECGVLRIDGGIRVEALNGFAEGFSEMAIY